MNTLRSRRQGGWVPRMMGAILWAMGMFGGQEASADGAYIRSLTAANGVLQLQYQSPVPLLPGIDRYELRRALDPLGPWLPVADGTYSEWRWEGPAPSSRGFYRVDAVEMSPQDVWAANLLRRVTYGPSPEEWDRIRAIGPETYLAEQLAPETLPDEMESLPPLPAPENGWRKVEIRGISSEANPPLYIYLEEPGEAYIDDVRLVAGDGDDGSKPVLLRTGNGDFEKGLATGWTVSANLTGSAVTGDRKHGGNTSLHMVATAEGSSQGTSIWQATTGVVAGGAYTLSFWYYAEGGSATPVVRVSGAGTYPVTGLTSKQKPSNPGRLRDMIQGLEGTIDDLRSWHLGHAIGSRRQLLEVMRQFCENHFVTQYSKVSDYMDNFYSNASGLHRFNAVRMELSENLKWREILMKPQGTFYELLKVSAESPSMIIYLDTVESKGDVDSKGVIKAVANENYARELCELFCFGVDNGYDQQDIVEISKAWTGWSIGYVRPENQGNPFAPDIKGVAGIADDRGRITNNVGVWHFRYKPTSHHQGRKWCFYEHTATGGIDTNRMKTVPERFGAPWAGRPYGLLLDNGSRSNGTIEDGYQVLKHMADQPFTQEYISVKLCRLFVHDGFRHGYNFADEESTPEEQLVRECMLAWENPPNGGPKGQVRDVLRVILSSNLFRSQEAAQQKVKTPLEYAVSVVRALRAKRPEGGYTSDSNGYALAGILNRAGRMRLFDRAEPDGYPEDAPGWISAGTLAERLRFVQAAMHSTRDNSSKADAGVETLIDPVQLLKLKRPDAMLNAEAVADYFVEVLFAGEGRANLRGLRDLAVQFLNTSDDGSRASPLSGLAVTSTVYDDRIRGMVAMLMTTQRFQEQ